jgi:hypothetical protein
VIGREVCLDSRLGSENARRNRDRHAGYRRAPACEGQLGVRRT